MGKVANIVPTGDKDDGGGFKGGVEGTGISTQYLDSEVLKLDTVNKGMIHGQRFWITWVVIRGTASGRGLRSGIGVDDEAWVTGSGAVVLHI